MIDASPSRWVNLWPPESFTDRFLGFIPSIIDASEEPEAGQSEDSTERDVSPRLTSDLSSAVFLGNFALFLALLTAIFVVHVAVASGVEAYWIAKVRIYVTSFFLW